MVLITEKGNVRGRSMRFLLQRLNMALMDWLRKRLPRRRGTELTQNQPQGRWQDEQPSPAEPPHIEKRIADPVAQTSIQPRELERQKQAWLEQQKIEWFERKRAVWEAEGKPIPWAEWLSRREYEWTANELPNRELHWARQHERKTEATVL